MRVEDYGQFVKRQCQNNACAILCVRLKAVRQALGGNSRTTLLVAASACARASYAVSVGVEK